MNQLAFVEEIAPVETAPHISESVPSEHVSTSEEEPSHTSSSTSVANEEDTTHSTSSAPFIYPYWLYVSHPSAECQKTGNNCPAVNAAIPMIAIAGVLLVVMVIASIVYIKVKE